jgi:hypothetical protein
VLFCCDRGYFWFFVRLEGSTPVIVEWRCYGWGWRKWEGKEIMIIVFHCYCYGCHLPKVGERSLKSGCFNVSVARVEVVNKGINCATDAW